jgi:hypothetical protein
LWQESFSLTRLPSRLASYSTTLSRCAVGVTKGFLLKEFPTQSRRNIEGFSVG